MLFKKNNSPIIITEVSLKKEYAFMYESFVVSSQQTLFLLLEQTRNKIDALKFNFLIYKYGYPNDEANHPMTTYGLGSYGFFRVNNSPWVTEIRNNNRSHHRHSDSMFDNDSHYIAKFKDVTIEIISTKMEEVELTKAELLAFIEKEINSLKK